MNTDKTLSLPKEVSAHAILRFLERVGTDTIEMVQEAREILNRTPVKGSVGGWWPTEIEGIYAMCSPRQGDFDHYKVIEVASVEEVIADQRKVHRRVGDSVVAKRVDLEDKAVVQLLRLAGADEEVEIASSMLLSLCPDTCIADIVRVQIPALPGWRLVIGRNATCIRVVTILPPSLTDTKGSGNKTGSPDHRPRHSKASRGFKNYSSRQRGKVHRAEKTKQERKDKKKVEQDGRRGPV